MSKPILLYRGDFFNANFTYHSGVDIDHSFLIMDSVKKTLLVPKMNLSIARKKFSGKVLAYDDPKKSIGKILNGKDIKADLSSISARAYKGFSSFCNLEDYTPELLRMRLEKKSDEIKKLSRASKITKDLIASLEIREGMTEKELRSGLLISMMEMGLDPSFEPIISSGRNTSYPHSTSTGKRIAGHVLIDCGVRYKGYCGDITRCIFLKKGTKAEKSYMTIKDVANEVIDRIPDCNDSSEVALLAEKIMKRKKLPKLIHSIGHGIGLAVHEYPRLSKKYQDRIEKSTFTIEPGVYGSSFGVRFEQMVYFNGKKARVI
jgi:Xaa-Pro aminopeptidase